MFGAGEHGLSLTYIGVGKNAVQHSGGNYPEASAQVDGFLLFVVGKILLLRRGG